MVWTEKYFHGLIKKAPHHKSIPKTAVHNGMNIRLFSRASRSFSVRFMPCCFIPTAAVGPLSCRPCGRCKGACHPSQILQSLMLNRLFNLGINRETCFRNALTHPTVHPTSYNLQTSCNSSPKILQVVNIEGCLPYNYFNLPPI